MPLGNFVLDEDPAPLPQRGQNLPIFDLCLLWPNGWMVKMALGMEVGLGPGHIVLDGDPAPLPKKGVQPPNFWPMSIVRDGGGGHWLLRMEWRQARWWVCLPLLIIPCTIKSRSFLVAPAHPVGPGKRAVKRLWWSIVAKQLDGSRCYLVRR